MSGAPPAAPPTPREPAWWPAALALVPALAAALRFHGLAGREFWLDEVRTLLDLDYPRPRHWQHVGFFDAAAQLRAWFPAMPDELALRIHPVLCGVMLVLAAMVAGRWLSGHRAGLAAGLLAALSPAALAFAREARFYAPVALFGALGVACAALALRTQRLGPRLALALAAGLLAWQGEAHHPAALPALGASAATVWALAAAASHRALAERAPAGWPRRALPALYAAAGAGAALAAWRLLGDRVPAWDRFAFAATPGVEATPAFFAQVLSGLLLDGRADPAAGAASLAALLALSAGVVFLAAARRGGGLLLATLPPILATVAAVFAVTFAQVFQPKYAVAVQPALLLLAAGLAAEFEEVLRARGNSARIPPLAPWIALALLLLPAAPRLREQLALESAAFRAPLAQALAEPESRVFVYGHAAYQAWHATRADPGARARLRHIPWQRNDGSEEAAMLAREAQAGPAYFLQLWPHDVPPAVRGLLARSGREVLRVPSARGAAHDSVLFRLEVPGAEAPANAPSFGDLSDRWSGIQSDVPPGVRVLRARRAAHGPAARPADQWLALTPATLAPLPDAPEGARFRYAPHAVGRVVSPMLDVAGAEWVEGVVELRLDECWGAEANALLLFTDRRGALVAEREASGPLLRCRVEWEPATEPLRGGRFHRLAFRSPVPEGAERAAVVIVLHPATRRFPAARNEVRFGLCELRALAR
ncbi:MAG: hypothetical protein SF028_13830 [Candidatus Sumerlaeia bacterium]|nr:hypothetical protein [Candidatus Sumerlaeia bacterium]